MDSTTPLGLSDEQIAHIWDTHVGDWVPKYPFGATDVRNFARAVIAAHEQAQAKAQASQGYVHFGDSSRYEVRDGQLVYDDPEKVVFGPDDPIPAYEPPSPLVWDEATAPQSKPEQPDGAKG